MEDYRELALRAAKGDKRAFSEIYVAFRSRLASFAQRCFPWMSFADVQDVIHESFVSALKNIHNFRGDHAGSLATWLMRIVLHECLKEAKAHYRHEKGGYGEDLLDFQEDSNLSPEDLVSLKEFVQLIDDAIKRLSPFQRAAICNRMEGFTPSESSERIGKSKGEEASLVSRAKMAVRETMSEYEEALSFLGLNAKEPSEAVEKAPKRKPKPKPN